ncbi:AraC family transcriptional regulator [Oceanirhabdus seepicola]|uniref:Helix-turn-helix transcriptional regulator n=1 Tax=Oceanirhabdus seepicola TaxID=2828781 RepID=A0A9J6P7N3_9CLOT|nr:AraC family transcriptional regulator [Oceanirhabdus seepicola]MCM1991821.1 helix-turn-helix transcriptional regulator [Oceanirhabdus seepicola]
MEFDILKASEELSKLDIKINTGNMNIDILWFRVMKKIGEWKIKRHRHSSFEFHFIASGGCKVIHDNGEFHVNSGEFYITAPGVYHTQISNHNEEYVEYSLNCDINIIEETISEEKQLFDILKNSQCIQHKGINHINELFKTALEEAYYKRLGFYNKIKNIVQMLLIESARFICKTTELSYEIPMKYKKDDYRFIQIERYIVDNLDTAISTKDIAVYMHLSDKQICRIIQQSKGISTKEYICRLKFSKAKELLKNTEHPIGEISEMLGFSSQYYFNQFFKIRESYSPSKFRKNVKYV